MHNLLAVFLLLAIASLASGGLLYSLKTNGRTAFPPAKVDEKSGTGFLMCAGDRMVGEAVQMIWQLRHKWKSLSRIAVAHCGEISPQNQEFMKLVDPTVLIIDLCATNPVLGMSLDTARYRLRGFMCKVAATILSPFNHTMLLDLDVVWFKPPDKLFSSESYTETGALFFRDRVYPATDNRLSDWRNLQKFFAERGVPQDLDSVQALARSNGGSFFWRHVQSTLPGGVPFSPVNDIQDSSVVVIDKTRHAKLLATMTELLPNFDYGYGDKELFWIAATLARSNFTFEPFLAAQYADCYGVILHYDPDDALNPSHASPLYINAEYMVEKDLTIVGEFLSDKMTPPILVTLEMKLSMSLDTWTPGHGRGMNGCTCESFGCIDAPRGVVKHVFYVEWLTYSKRLPRSGPQEDCVPFFSDYVDLANEVFNEWVMPQECFFVGCPHLPLVVDKSLPWIEGTDHRIKICDPVYFAAAAPANMSDIAQAARKPDSPQHRHKELADGTPVQCGNQRQLYWYKQGELHPFADWQAFVSKGLDLDQVVRLSPAEFDKFPRSERPVVANQDCC